MVLSLLKAQIETTDSLYEKGYKCTGWKENSFSTKDYYIS